MYRNVLAVIDIDDTINDGQVIDTLEQKMDGDINVHLDNAVILDDDSDSAHERYLRYLQGWIFNHSDPLFEGCSPAGFDEWKSNEDEENNEEEEQKMFNERTSAGYQIITIIPDGSQEHVICKREMSWGDDYVVGLGYHREDGTWNQGMYSYKTVDDALEALIDVKYSFKKNSLINKLLEYVDLNTDTVEELYQVLIGKIQMTESEIKEYGYEFCIPEKEESDENV